MHHSNLGVGRCGNASFVPRAVGSSNVVVTGSHREERCDTLLWFLVTLDVTSKRCQRKEKLGPPIRQNIEPFPLINCWLPSCTLALCERACACVWLHHDESGRVCCCRGSADRSMGCGDHRGRSNERDDCWNHAVCSVLPPVLLWCEFVCQLKCLTRELWVQLHLESVRATSAVLLQVPPARRMTVPCCVLLFHSASSTSCAALMCVRLILKCGLHALTRHREGVRATVLLQVPAARNCAPCSIICQFYCLSFGARTN